MPPREVAPTSATTLIFQPYLIQSRQRRPVETIVRAMQSRDAMLSRPRENSKRKVLDKRCADRRARLPTTLKVTGLSFLESSAIQPASLDVYLAALQMFDQFCAEAGLTTDTMEALDEAMVSFMNADECK